MAVTVLAQLLALSLYLSAASSLVFVKLLSLSLSLSLSLRLDATIWQSRLRADTAVAVGVCVERTDYVMDNINIDLIDLISFKLLLSNLIAVTLSSKHHIL